LKGKWVNPKMNRKTAKKTKLVAGALVILLFIGIGFSALSGFINPYKTVSEVVQNPEDYANRLIQVEGYVVRDTVTWEPGDLEFNMTDGKLNLSVVYLDVLPANFPVNKNSSDDSRLEVVVIGSLTTPARFNATQILVKCPSKYEAALNETSDA